MIQVVQIAGALLLVLGLYFLPSKTVCIGRGVCWGFSQLSGVIVINCLDGKKADPEDTDSEDS